MSVYGAPGQSLVNHIGPLYCETCGAWPAMHCEQGPRCHLCELRDFAAANPVPLPNGSGGNRDADKATG